MTHPIALTVRGLTVQRAGRTLLNDVGFEASVGRVVGIVGPNGAGKSTLLSCIYRHCAYQAGEIVVNGRDVRSISRKELARQIAAVPQDTQLAFDLTVEDIVSAGRIPHSSALGLNHSNDRDMIDLCLRRVNLEHLRYRSAATLSGGERQRALLGRALAQESPILILDEPTNHLDLANQEQLLALIRDHAETTLIAIHDLNLAVEYCDHIVVLAAGQVVAAGEPSAVITRELLQEVFGVRCHIVEHPESGRPHIISQGRSFRGE